MESFYLLDKYASVTPGEPYRLFPFGTIIKDGKSREITPELAAKFKLPHYKPPIKRGSHRDDAPAGGFIIGLEVREDGLYAIPELNEKGAQVITDGDYRYHSPEVIWDEGPVFENPDTGEFLHGPLIVGDALLHSPHLGEAAALYSVEPLEPMEGNMTDQVEMVEVPKKWYESIFAAFSAKEPEPKTEELISEPVTETEEYKAAVQERDELQAKFDNMAAEASTKARVDKYTAAVGETKANTELVALLAGLEEETADRIVQEFKALTAQIVESNLTDEVGTSGEGVDNPVEKFQAAIAAKAAEKSLNYTQAMRAVIAEQPDLYNAYEEGN